ncbi:mitochondrial ribosomal protein subunit L20-domain-containing protein [Gautieria morchelliformis]|nr:mitochondrial ribosomal protein subunit L20-domain-containing protein [Gautieria morchelliformis]
MKLPLRVGLPAAVRGYATRRPERPPPKIKDPLLSANAVHHQIAPNLTFIHRPPPTAPTPFSLSTAPSSPLLLPATPVPSSDASTSTRLPPRIQKPQNQPETKLTDEQIEEIRRLRTADPIVHTRQKLAKQFGCSPAYIPMVAPLRKAETRKALARRDQEHEANRSRWGERKEMVVAIRKKRRSLW